VSVCCQKEQKSFGTPKRIEGKKHSSMHLRMNHPMVHIQAIIQISSRLELCLKKSRAVEVNCRYRSQDNFVPTAMFLTGKPLPHFKKKSSIPVPSASKHLSIRAMAPWVSLPGDDVPLPLLLLDAWVSQNHINPKGVWFFPEVCPLT
jgi:hypothetical protein